MMYPDQIDTTKNYTENGKTYYIVQDGDELWAIATANHTSVGYLAVINHIPRTADVKTGKKLVIAING
ncbi:hypothetical protein G8J22_02378 [Lentilactobacillus hilgardii]|uniref:LysM peptidoglycan-binding domain-containing protein n=1 Tax=Lentilactobacillus hilgardii TaxID=1588 RepID=UPI00019C5D07|nr:LysM domain-containing protein [Lentilactobacillus hilgardii]EEI19554.1 LysM domain protein [Lentilactobacillus buchneri ATCC 11577]QIR10370.1 hypothetical protein G8J22_02378 [Lentilactobacillus hilgardii]